MTIEEGSTRVGVRALAMSPRVLLGLVVGIAACASAPEGSLPDRGAQAMSDEAARAIGISRTAILADPAKHRSVWGSPLQLDRASPCGAGLRFLS